ncbi:MAG: hypothetical protein Q8N26_11490 [Myxococcales bacterium]|nr:hypothetical protein [Myxococcales bacterium]
MWLGLLTVAMLAAPADAPVETSEYTLTAERMLHDGVNKRTIAEGRAHLETSGVAIDAERILYDQNRQTIVAVGRVVARIAQEGTPTAILAEVAEFKLEGEQITEVHVLDGKAFAKAGANVPKLLAAKTQQELDAAGASTMLMSGNHFVRVDDGWRMEDLELTPCDCDMNSPSWSIRATEAVVNKAADRVAVRWPVPWIKKVPLVGEVPLPITSPWLSLPLGNRATGLLFPRPGSTVLNGFSFEQPVFVTAGRSADFTFTPGYFFGGPKESDRFSVLERRDLDRNLVPRRGFVLWRNGENDVAPTTFQQPFGIEGPRLLSEFRYVLSPRAQGRMTLGLLYDLRGQRDPGNANLGVARPRGLRGEASAFHTQDFGGGFGTRVDLSAYSDGYYQRDVTPDVIAREAGYLRSTAVLFHRGVDHLVTLDTVLRQDLTAGYDLFGRDVFPRSVNQNANSQAPRFGPNPIQRLPGLTFSLPVRTLTGPLAFDLTADAVQQMPLRLGTGDEGALANEGRSFDPETGLELPAECVVERLYLARFPNQLAQCPQNRMGGPLSPSAGVGDGRWQLGERESRFRLNVMPRLWAAGALANAVALSATAGWRQGLWAGQSSGRTTTRGYPLLAARAEFEVARVFGKSLRHSFTPIFEARAVPFVVATSTRANDPSLLGGPAPYDELDRSISDNRPRVQAIAEVRNRLVTRGGQEVIRLDVGQGFDLLSPVTPGPGGVLAPETMEAGRFNAPRLAESYARLVMNVGWFTVAGQARFEPTLPSPRLTRGSASASCFIPGGHSLNATYENVLDDGTNRARAPIDLLFGDPVVATSTSRAQLLSGGAATRFGPFGLRYDIVLFNRQWPRRDASGTILKDLMGRDLQDVLLSFGQHSVGITWTPACDCFRLDLSVAQRLTGAGGLGPLEFVGFNFSVARLGSIGTAN